MDYIQREPERKFLEENAFLKAVPVIGARQVGKSTMLKRLVQKKQRTIVSMDSDCGMIHPLQKKSANPEKKRSGSSASLKRRPSNADRAGSSVCFLRLSRSTTRTA